MMYIRFPLRMRNVEGLIVQRGSDVRHETHCLWRQVYHEGETLQRDVTKKSHKSAAARFFKKTLKRRSMAKSSAICAPQSLVAYNANSQGREPN